MKELIDPLVRALVEGCQDDIHFLLESRRSNGATAVLSTLGKPAFQNSYSTLVNDAVAEHSYRVLMAYLQERGQHFPGYEMLLEFEEGRWKVALHTLDDPDPSWAGLPRLPVRVVGHGYSLAPPAGKVFRWSQLREPVGILAAARNDQGAKEQVEIRIPSGESDVQLKVAPPQVAWQNLVELSEGPRLDEWWVEVRGFRFVWPPNVDLGYPLATGKQVELLGRDQSLICLQGPVQRGLVDLNDMASPDQRQTDRGSDWVELAYAAEGQNWRQRHYLKDCGQDHQVVVTAQGPENSADEIFASAASLSQSLLPPTC